MESARELLKQGADSSALGDHHWTAMMRTLMNEKMASANTLSGAVLPRSEKEVKRKMALEFAKLKGATGAANDASHAASTKNPASSAIRPRPRRRRPENPAKAALKSRSYSQCLERHASARCFASAISAGFMRSASFACALSNPAMLFHI